MGLPHLAKRVRLSHWHSLHPEGRTTPVLGTPETESSTRLGENGCGPGGACGSIGKLPNEFALLRKWVKLLQSDRGPTTQMQSPSWKSPPRSLLDRQGRTWADSAHTRERWVSTSCRKPLARSTQGLSGVDQASIRNGPAVDPGSIRRRSGVDPKWIRNGSGVDLVRSRVGWRRDFGNTTSVPAQCHARKLEQCPRKVLRSQCAGTALVLCEDFKSTTPILVTVALRYDFAGTTLVLR